jgi:hypothetical protein
MQIHFRSLVPYQRQNALGQQEQVQLASIATIRPDSVRFSGNDPRDPYKTERAKIKAVMDDLGAKFAALKEADPAGAVTVSSLNEAEVTLNGEPYVLTIKHTGDYKPRYMLSKEARHFPNVEVKLSSKEQVVTATSKRTVNEGGQLKNVIEETISPALEITFSRAFHTHAAADDGFLEHLAVIVRDNKKKKEYHDFTNRKVPYLTGQPQDSRLTHTLVQYYNLMRDLTQFVFSPERLQNFVPAWQF